MHLHEIYPFLCRSLVLLQLGKGQIKGVAEEMNLTCLRIWLTLLNPFFFFHQHNILCYLGHSLLHLKTRQKHEIFPPLESVLGSSMTLTNPLF